MLHLSIRWEPCPTRGLWLFPLHPGCQAQERRLGKCERDDRSGGDRVFFLELGAQNVLCPSHQHLSKSYSTPAIKGVTGWGRCPGVSARVRGKPKFTLGPVVTFAERVFSQGSLNSV